jgi:hypothetical protein
MAIWPATSAREVRAIGRTRLGRWLGYGDEKSGRREEYKKSFGCDKTAEACPVHSKLKAPADRAPRPLHRLDPNGKSRCFAALRMTCWGSRRRKAAPFLIEIEIYDPTRSESTDRYARDETRWVTRKQLCRELKAKNRVSRPFTHRERRPHSYADGHPSIGKFWRPILASFGQEVEQIPDRRKEVYASVV